MTIIILLCAAIFAGILIWDVYCAEAGVTLPRKDSQHIFAAPAKNLSGNAEVNG
ncbi:hypothetical protein [Cloacibacillus evryensis]|uniref:hypothetical protein n=1 Tax=Cloacibacillus evryensis TaxID=508460 RepID=UPI00210A2E8E|nr:hypothetical protein [Cloacibacillus evryensis]